MAYKWVRSSESTFEARPSFGFPMTVMHSNVQLYRELSPAILERVFDGLYRICELSVGTSQCISLDGDHYDLSVGKTEYAIANESIFKSTMMIGLDGEYEAVTIEFIYDGWVIKNANNLISMVMGLSIGEINDYLETYVYPYALTIEAIFFGDVFQSMIIYGEGGETEVRGYDIKSCDLFINDLNLIFKLKTEEHIHTFSFDHEAPTLTFSGGKVKDWSPMNIVITSEISSVIYFEYDQGVTRMKLTVPILMMFIKWQRSISQMYHRYIGT